jgi:hypothetical protein
MKLTIEITGDVRADLEAALYEVQRELILDEVEDGDEPLDYPHSGRFKWNIAGQPVEAFGVSCNGVLWAERFPFYELASSAVAQRERGWKFAAQNVHENDHAVRSAKATLCIVKLDSQGRIISEE